MRDFAIAVRTSLVEAKRAATLSSVVSDMMFVWIAAQCFRWLYSGGPRGAVSWVRTHSMLLMTCSRFPAVQCLVGFQVWLLGLCCSEIECLYRQEEPVGVCLGAVASPEL